jgi:AcrR family transcriptional regulator
MSTAVASRGRPRSAEADRAIIVATLTLLEELGFARLTMAGVADRAGVSTATLYRRWSSKEELVVAALEALVPERSPADTGTLEGDLRETLRRMSENLAGDRGRILLGVSGEVLRHPALGDAVRARLSDPMRDNLAAMVERAVARGEIPPPADVKLAAAVMVGPLHYLLLSGEPPGPEVVDTLVPMLLRAVGAG